MKFQPKTDKEIAEEGLKPEGVYPFEISGAEHHVSKTSGNESIRLTVRVFYDDDKIHLVDDYLTPKFSYKFKNVFKALGLMDYYEKGDVSDPEIFVGKTGYLDLTIQKDKNGVYPDRNAIKKYHEPEEETVETKPASTETKDDFADDIPFWHNKFC